MKIEKNVDIVLLPILESAIFKVLCGRLEDLSIEEAVSV